MQTVQQTDYNYERNIRIIRKMHNKNGTRFS